MAPSSLELLRNGFKYDIKGRNVKDKRMSLEVRDRMSNTHIKRWEKIKNGINL